MQKRPKKRWVVRSRLYKWWGVVGCSLSDPYTSDNCAVNGTRLLVELQTVRDKDKAMAADIELSKRKLARLAHNSIFLYREKFDGFYSYLHSCTCPRCTVEVGRHPSDTANFKTINRERQDRILAGMHTDMSADHEWQARTKLVSDLVLEAVEAKMPSTYDEIATTRENFDRIKDALADAVRNTKLGETL